MPTELDFSVLDPASAILSLRSDLRLTPCEFDGEDCYMVEDPLRGKYFRIGADEFALISFLNGKNTIAQAIGLSADILEERAFTENEAMSVCHWLLESQLALCGGAAQGERLAVSAHKQAQNKLVAAVNPMAMRFPLLNPNRLLVWLAPWIEWVFSPWAVAGWCLVCLMGLLVAIEHRGELVQSSSVLLDRDNWLALAVVWLGLKLLHEAAHGLACLHFGGNVPSAGVLLIMFAPLPFVDVTASWRFSSKWHRIATAAAGVYVELFVAALALIVWSWSTSSVVRHDALNVAATAGLASLLVNGNPLMRFDGYYILSDWLEMPNLSGSGQKYLAGLFQQVMGVDVPPDNRSPRTRRIIAVYAVASLVWRNMVYAGLLLVLYAMASKLGAFIADTALVLAVAAILLSPVRNLVRFLGKQQTLSRKRLGVVAGIALAGIGLVAFLLTRPGTTRACGIVDYSPPTIVRSASPGLVKEVKVRDGEAVEPGQIIALLENESLRADLANIRYEIEKSRLQQRIHHQGEETAKQQAEIAKSQSLQKKELEIKKQVDGLTVRAPAAGNIVAHKLDSLPGRYLAVGDEIVVIGNEKSKEVVLAAAQNDISSFMSQLSRPVKIRPAGDEGNSFTAGLTKIEPRASTKLPHAALGADAGGPLPVSPKRESAQSKKVESELLDPCFSGTVLLDEPQSVGLHAGQRVTVLFSSSQQSWAANLVARLRKWIDDRLANTNH